MWQRTLDISPTIEEDEHAQRMQQLSALSCLGISYTGVHEIEPNIGQVADACATSIALLAPSPHKLHHAGRSQGWQTFQQADPLAQLQVVQLGAGTLLSQVADQLLVPHQLFLCLQGGSP